MAEPGGRPLITGTRHQQTQPTGKTALVVEGGGMRAIFAAGVLHAFGEAGFDPFDLYLGTSAGACCLASHLAGQNNRNEFIFTTYSTSSKFINGRRFLRGGHFMDLDWLWDKTISEYRLDLETIFLDPNRCFVVVVTDVETGQPVYLEPTAANLEHCLKVSSALPLMYRGFLSIDNKMATDGGVADAIPIGEAIRRGATTIFVVRTQPPEYIKKISIGAYLTTFLFLRYPALRRQLLSRAATYQASLALIADPPEGIRVQQIAPDGTFQTGRTTRDKAVLQADYLSGIKAGQAAMRQWPGALPVNKNGEA